MRIDLCLIGLHGAAVLLDQRRLGVERLPRDRVLRHERFVAGQVELGVFEHRLILRELPFRLSQRDLIGPRIDMGEEVALVDHLAFLERDLDELAVDLRLDRDHGERRHRTQSAEDDRHVAFFHRRGADRHRPAGLEAPGCRRLWARAKNQPQHQRSHNQQKDPVTQRHSEPRVRRWRLARATAAGPLVRIGEDRRVRRHLDAGPVGAIAAAARRRLGQ